MESKVSIIVPIYNVEKYIEKCINSILNQTYRNLEIILVNDCSTDNSEKVLKEIIKADNRCIYIEKKENGGLAAARNTGIKKATGDYLVFVDSDDWISEEYVQKLLKAIKTSQADIAVCDYATVDEKGNCVIANSLFPLNDKSTLNEKVAYIRNHSVTKMINRKSFKEEDLLFPEYIKRAEDMGTIIPLLTKAKKIELVNEPLYYYFQRKGSLSNKIEKGKNLDFYDKAYQLIVKNAKTGFEKEIEYHGILEMVYGKTMLMIKYKYSYKDIKKHLKNFDKEWPDWRKNQYIKNMIFLKKIFVKCASLKLITLLKIMVIINEKRK